MPTAAGEIQFFAWKQPFCKTMLFVYLGLFHDFVGIHIVAHLGPWHRNFLWAKTPFRVAHNQHPEGSNGWDIS